MQINKKKYSWQKFKQVGESQSKGVEGVDNTHRVGTVYYSMPEND
jgi:hypothetical protein